MPIDPFAALNAMLRAEAARSTPQPQSVTRLAPKQPQEAQERAATAPDRERAAIGSEEPLDCA